MRKNILGPIAVATALAFGSTPTHAQSAPDAIVLNTQAGMQSALQDKSKEIGSVLQIQSKEAAICSLGITVRDPNNVDYCDALERQKIKQEKEDEEKKRLYEQLALLTGTGALGVLAYGRWGAPYMSKRKRETREREELGMNDQLNELSWEKNMTTNTAGKPDSISNQNAGIDHALEARLREKAKTARLEREEQEGNAPKGQKKAKEDDSFDLSGDTLGVEPKISGTTHDDDLPSLAEQEAAINELLTSEEFTEEDNLPGGILDIKEKNILEKIKEKPDDLESYKDLLRIYYAKNDIVAFAEIYMRDELAQFRSNIVDYNITWIRELGRKMDPENPIYKISNDFQDTVIPPEWSETVTPVDTPENTNTHPVTTSQDWTKTVAMETSDIGNTQENQIKVHIDRSLRTRLERGGFEIQEDSHTGEVSILVKKEGTSLSILKLVAAPIGQRHENLKTIECGDIYILGKDIVQAELDPSMNYIKLISSNHTRTLIRINE